MDTNTGDLILKYGEIVETSYILIPQTEPPLAEFFGEGALIKLINLYTSGFNIISGLENHISGCFRLFVPKFWEAAGTYEWYFVIL